MNGLKVLNLSHTNIKKLPDSVSDLENLSALLVHGCWNLSSVPSLIRLKKLRELDMHHSRIKEVPEGFDGLSNLQCLDLSQIKDLCIPIGGVISRIPYLQILKVSQAIKGKDLTGLRHLEILQCWLIFDMNDWKMFNESRHQWKLKCYKFLLRETKWRLGNKHVETLHHNISSSFDRIMLLSTCSFDRGKEAMIPANIQFLGINGCNFKVRGLLDALSSFHDATELKVCEIKNCEGIEFCCACHKSWDKDGSDGPCWASTESAHIPDSIWTKDKREMATLKHFTHRCHPLKEFSEDNEFKCDGCEMLGIGQRYQCRECSFNLHMHCGHCPADLCSFMHPKHRLHLTLVQRSRASFSIKHACEVCGKGVRGLFYHYVEHSLELQHREQSNSCTVCGGYCSH
uniref:Phorbol-ester/DAG-type domain-containing protein n=1 Tax=Chenopodium quinoa TaxID=63459 RepID=A0A803LVI2_CHEQI